MGKFRTSFIIQSKSSFRQLIVFDFDFLGIYSFPKVASISLCLALEERYLNCPPKRGRLLFVKQDGIPVGDERKAELSEFFVWYPSWMHKGAINSSRLLLINNLSILSFSVSCRTASELCREQAYEQFRERPTRLVLIQSLLLVYKGGVLWLLLFSSLCDTPSLLKKYTSYAVQV
jgi:hypothetical protein